METKNEEMKEFHHAYLIVTLCCSPRGSADDPCCKAPEAAVGDGGVQGVDLGAHFLAEPVVEVVQHLFQNLTGGGILIEVVGIREKEALKAVDICDAIKQLIGG